MEYELIDDSECHNFVKGASLYLVPVLLRCMTMQEEGQVPSPPHLLLHCSRA